MTELKYYQCIKQVHAEPMTFGEFLVTYKGANDPSARAEDTPGYHVVYSKGLADEYHSWSPKAAFEEGYLEIPDTTVSQPARVGGQVS